jgi:hypothetical protein
MAYRRNFIDVRMSSIAVVANLRYAADRLGVREDNIGNGGKHPVKKTEITAVGIRHAGHVEPSILKRWL